MYFNQFYSIERSANLIDEVLLIIVLFILILHRTIQ
jgi:hypothetical protein